MPIIRVAEVARHVDPQYYAQYGFERFYTTTRMIEIDTAVIVIFNLF